VAVDPIQTEQATLTPTATANGHDPAPVPISGARRLPVAYATVQLDGEYEGWWAEVRTNPRYSTIEMLSDPVRVYEGIAEIVKRWNFVDEEGQEIPATADGCKVMPVDLGLILIQKWNDVRKLPPESAGR
jgi:hypothetical protein